MGPAGSARYDSAGWNIKIQSDDEDDYHGEARVSVAILSTATFDASLVYPASAVLAATLNRNRAPLVLPLVLAGVAIFGARRQRSRGAPAASLRQARRDHLSRQTRSRPPGRNV